MVAKVLSDLLGYSQGICLYSILNPLFEQRKPVKMKLFYFTIFLQDGVIFVNSLDSHSFVEC